MNQLNSNYLASELDSSFCPLTNFYNIEKMFRLCMKLLRDKRESTKLLLLFELTTGRYRAFKPLAEKFDITIQAISDYFKIMTDEGLVHKIDGTYRPTPQGVEFLHNNFTELREFVDSGIEKLTIINKTSAIAGNRISKGDNLGLFMENGTLFAYSDRRSSSTGTAVSAADKGQEVGISELDGIVKLKPGKIIIFKLPGLDKGGSKAVNQKNLRSKLEQINFDKLAVKGTIAEVMARKIKLNEYIKFAVVESSLEASQLGLNIVILTSEEYISELRAELEKSIRDLTSKIEYKISKI
jgi:putative transcriptional regulator